MAWSFASDRPIYLQIADRLRADIIVGRYKAGERVPSVRELAQEAAVNPNTAQRALNELEAYGLLTISRTIGRYVTKDEDAIRWSRQVLAAEIIQRYLREMARIGYDSTQACAKIEQNDKQRERGDADVQHNS